MYGLNLLTSHINNLNTVGHLTNDYILYDNCLVKMVSDRFNAKTYQFYNLNNGEINIKSTSYVFPYYVKTWEGHTFNSFAHVQEELDEFNENKSNYNQYPNIKHNIYGIDVIRTEFNWKGKIFTLSGELRSFPSIGINVPFTLSGAENSIIRFKDCVVGEVSTNGQTEESKETDNNEYTLPLGEKLLGKSNSGNLIVSITSNKKQVYYRNVKEGSKHNILSNLFDSSHYKNAFFTSDGKKAIIKEQDDKLKIVGFENLSIDEFDVEGFSVPLLDGCNGYKPEVSILDSRQPVWRNPISLVKVKPEELSNHIFMSSDGVFSAQNDYEIIVKNRITNEDVTDEDYRSLSKKYNFLLGDSDEIKKKKIRRRKKLLEEVGKEILFRYVIDCNSRLIMNSTHIPENEKEKHLSECIDSDIKKYINKTDSFTPLFLDELGYVVYKSNKTPEEKRILIGRSVYFLNYVSFSYDSRYLAFAAKMKSDTFRSSEDGVFVLYDLMEEKEIVRQDHSQGLYAVWMALFSKDGNVAYYDSKADSYLITKESDYKEIQKIEGKSLLCFSPSGKYIAFSDQNYIDYTHHPDANWGHQPSGNIFIHAVKDIQVCLKQFNDFGNGIKGVVFRAGSVASVAFSSDEQRMMAVGDDGVVVVRNLHLDEMKLDPEPVIGKELYHFDNNPHYGEYAGTYAQDVMGYSDDVINDAFDGEPDAYWNID